MLCKLQALQKASDTGNTVPVCPVVCMGELERLLRRTRMAERVGGLTMAEQCKDCAVYQVYARMFDVHIDRLDCPNAGENCFKPYKKAEG